MAVADDDSETVMASWKASSRRGRAEAAAAKNDRETDGDKRRRS
jgi:hypothetical protein